MPNPSITIWTWEAFLLSFADVVLREKVRYQPVHSEMAWHKGFGRISPSHWGLLCGLGGITADPGQRFLSRGHCLSFGSLDPSGTLHGEWEGTLESSSCPPLPPLLDISGRKNACKNMEAGPKLLYSRKRVPSLFPALHSQPHRHQRLLGLAPGIPHTGTWREVLSFFSFYWFKTWSWEGVNNSNQMTVLGGLHPEVSKCRLSHLGMGAGVRRMKKPLPLILISRRSQPGSASSNSSFPSRNTRWIHQYHRYFLSTDLSQSLIQTQLQSLCSFPWATGSLAYAEKHSSTFVQ